jgi:hypothetical protein
MRRASKCSKLSLLPSCSSIASGCRGPKGPPVMHPELLYQLALFDPLDLAEWSFKLAVRDKPRRRTVLRKPAYPALRTAEGSRCRAPSNHVLMAPTVVVAKLAASMKAARIPTVA